MENEDLGHWQFPNSKNLENLRNQFSKFCVETPHLDGSPVGFVYVILAPSSNDPGEPPLNRWYIGQKRLTKSAPLKPLVGRKNKRRRRLESNWRNYCSSCKELEADIKRLGEDRFTFYICGFCHSFYELNYTEAQAILITGALLDPASLNGYLRAHLGRPPATFDRATLDATLEAILLLTTDKRR